MFADLLIKKIQSDKASNIDELSTYFKIANPELYEQLNNEIDKLIIDKKIYFYPELKLYIDATIVKPDTLIGKINTDKKGNGYINFLDKTYFISSKFLDGYLSDDLVFFKTENKQLQFEQVKQDAKPMFFADVIALIRRENKFLVGLVKQIKGKWAFFNDNPRITSFITITNYNEKYFNKKVKAKIISVNKDRSITAEIIEIIGNRFDPKLDSISVLAVNDVPIEFSPIALEEARKFAVLKSKETQNRKDLKDLTIITIDGDDSKDFDDAICVQKTNDGYTLWVAIADVSHYVDENSKLNEEAIVRSTSIYLPDMTVPMLPEILSNDYCSLNAHTDKLVLTAEIHLDNNGEVVNYIVYKGIMNSVRRCTYREVNDFFENKKNVFNKDISDMLTIGKELYLKIKKIKHAKGMIDFTMNESKILFDEKGAVSDIVTRSQKDAEMLIEQFMILANESVAHFLDEKVKYGVYRIHGQPQAEKLEKFKLATRAMNTYFEVPNNPQPKDIQKIIEKFDAKQSRILTILLLRCMEKAKYDYKNIGHFGLASSHYTHFTSPIRRYPDLIVHRMVSLFLEEKDSNHFDTKFLNYVCEKANTGELRAMDCEQTVVKMKKAEFMLNKVGNVFDALITSLSNFGFFVEIDVKPVEGVVHTKNIENSHIIFNSEKQLFINTKTKKEYRLGDRIKVRLIFVNKFKGLIDFTPVE